MTAGGLMTAFRRPRSSAPKHRGSTRRTRFRNAWPPEARGTGRRSPMARHAAVRTEILDRSRRGNPRFAAPSLLARGLYVAAIRTEPFALERIFRVHRLVAAAHYHAHIAADGVSRNRL